MDLQTQKNIANAIKLHRAAKYEPAKAIYQKALKAYPDNADVWHLLGVLHSEMGQYATAIEYIQKAIALNPRSHQMYHNLGLAYKGSGQIDIAIDNYKRAIFINPNYAEGYYKLGNAYNELGNLKTAINYYDKAAQLKPDNHHIWIWYGNAMLQQHRLKGAKQCFERALAIKPQLVEAHHNLGLVCKELQEYESSIRHFQAADKLDPVNSGAFPFLQRLYEESCNWENYETNRQKMWKLHEKSLAANQKSPINVFAALSTDYSPQAVAEIAKSHSAVVLDELKFVLPKFSFKFTPQSKPRLKIGYCSAHFRDHPTAHLTYNLYKSHDRNRFEIFGFSLASREDNSHYRQHIAETCDHFIDLTGHTDGEAATKIYNLGIDILIDLDGYISHARAQIYALRPAPVQLNYLGFPGTSGAPFYDYLIADETVITPETAGTYTEKIIYLPHSYQINDDQQIISDKVIKRQDYQLPEDAFVYCCFNNNYKIEPKIFSVWMDILAQAPKSVLWLFFSSSLAENNLRREAQKRHVDPTRLIFAQRVPKSEHLARHKCADLFLDTLFYNAHTTASDALWAGLPVLTTPGVNFPSRVGASLLKAVGLPELIMPDIIAYQDKALYFYHHPEELQKIREKLLAIRKTSPLFDTQRFVRNLERAYLKMWELYISGKSPETIHLIENK